MSLPADPDEALAGVVLSALLGALTYWTLQDPLVAGIVFLVTLLFVPEMATDDTDGRSAASATAGADEAAIEQRAEIIERRTALTPKQSLVVAADEHEWSDDDIATLIRRSPPTVRRVRQAAREAMYVAPESRREAEATMELLGEHTRV